MTKAARRSAVVVIACVLVTSRAEGQQVPTAADIAAVNAEAKKVSTPEAARSVELARRALADARRIGDRVGEAEALHNLAVGYFNQLAFPLAADFARQSAERYAAIGNGIGEAQGYNTLGLIAQSAGDLAQALDDHLRALKIRERIDDKTGLAYSLNNLGNVYRSTGDLARALEYHQRSLAIKTGLDDRLSEAFSHQNIGLVYFAMGDYASAIQAYRRGLAIRESNGDLRRVAQSLTAIGQAQAMTDPRTALDTFARAKAIRGQIDDADGEARTELNLAEVYIKLGDTASALAAAKRALTLIDGVDVPVLRANILRTTSDVEAARGKYQAALEHLRQSMVAHDQVFNEQNAARLQGLQTAYEAERRNQRILALEQASALQGSELARAQSVRTGLAVAVALSAVSLGLLFARYRLKQRSEAEARAHAEALAEALDRVQTLRGLLPICAACKKIRDDNGYWTQVEAYVAAHSSAEFTHSMCPSCAEEWYPELSATSEAPTTGV